MVTFRSATLLALALIFYVSQSAYQDTCSYVKTATDASLTPPHWGFAYPVDVCMTHVASGSPTYMKYVCDDSDQIKEEIWDSATCDGTLQGTQDPTATVESFSCTSYGDCPYMTVSHGPDVCDSNDYRVEAIIPEVCVEGLPPFGYSFFLKCSDTTVNYYAAAGCSGTVQVQDTSSCANMGSTIGYSTLGNMQTSGCMSMTYESPTMNPTTEPTYEPTVEPTSNPSDQPSESPTRNPSESPSESPSRNPSQTPSESPTAEPTVEPTNGPSKAPSKTPSAMPTMSPSDNPVASETTMAPGDDDDSGASYIKFAANVIIAMCLSLAMM